MKKVRGLSKKQQQKKTTQTQTAVWWLPEGQVGGERGGGKGQRGVNGGGKRLDSVWGTCDAVCR